MNKIIKAYKLLGQTPLQAVKVLRSQNPELTNIPITYAGRLDPMAEGLLLLLTGNIVHQKNKFLELPKTYQAQMIFGINTDTYDILGMPTGSPQIISPQEIKLAINSLLGSHQLPYPPYSSKTVSGKPLWVWARDNKLSEIVLPTRVMQVNSVQNIRIETLRWKDVHHEIISSINKVGGDFRQGEILKSWNKINQNTTDNQQISTATLELNVNSGTYIRALTQLLAIKLNTSVILSKLKRTSIGSYKL